MTFEVITPFLKGFHLILAKHLLRRDEDGWKFSEKRYLSYVHQKVADDTISEAEAEAEAEAELMLKAADEEGPPPPKAVLATYRLKRDLYALGEILKPMSPPDVLIRTNTILQILYGFGSTMLSNKRVKIQIGLCMGGRHRRRVLKLEGV
jgi:hypothetical protein